MAQIKYFLFPPSRNMSIEAVNLLNDKILAGKKYKTAAVLGTWVGCAPIVLSQYCDNVLSFDVDRDYNPTPEKLCEINEVNNVDIIRCKNKEEMLSKFIECCSYVDLIFYDECWEYVNSFYDKISIAERDKETTVIFNNHLLINIASEDFSGIDTKDERFVMGVVMLPVRKETPVEPVVSVLIEEPSIEEYVEKTSEETIEETIEETPEENVEPEIESTKFATRKKKGKKNKEKDIYSVSEKSIEEKNNEGV